MDPRRRLLDWIEADREKLVEFFSSFLSKPSPNPPGDTREAAAFIPDYLLAEDIDFRIVAPREEMPNVVAVATGNHVAA